MEETITTLQNEIMKQVNEFSYCDQAAIFRELEGFCSRQADEAMKIEYDLAAMEEFGDE